MSAVTTEGPSIPRSARARLGIAYLSTAVTFLLLDALWLGFIAKDLYARGIGHLLAESPNLAAAALFYALLPAALVWFAVIEGRTRDNWLSSALRGGVFGIVTYGTYDLSNWATLRDWPAMLSLIDILWGCALCASAGAAGAVGWSVSGHPRR
ncbi:MAG: DUF2177 family protein [Proteobacteria bacterium]|nr:DUF2177 family protein [Burkholderiales bacterium]